MDFEMNEERSQMEGEWNIEEKKVRYAGFWMRLWAFLLDGIIVFSLHGLFVYPFIRWQDLGQQTILFYTVNGVLTAIVTFLYFTLLTKYWSQTLGKRIFGLKVISRYEEELSWSTVLFREGIGRFILQSFFFMHILYVVVAFSRAKQGLHDMIADTYVIHEE